MKKYFLSLILFLTIIFLYTYKILYAFDYHPDFARDLCDLLSIIRGKLTLIGPKTSFGGIYNGPYYYYLFAPVFYLTKLNIYSLLIFNVFFFISGLVFFYFFIQKKFGILAAALSTLLIAFAPFYLTFSRMPWNGSSYLPLLLIFFTLLYFYDLNKNKLSLLVLGFLLGIIINIEMATALMLVFVSAYLLFLLKRKVDIFYFFSGLLLTFLPLLLFELRHNFVMLKNTFLVGTYKNIMVGKTLSIGKSLSSQLGINFLIYFLTVIYILVKDKENRNKLFSIGTILLFIIYSFVFRNHLAQHYLFPLSLFMIFTLIVSILNSRKVWLLAVLLLLEIFSFPVKIYDYNPRKPEKYDQRVKYVLDNNLIEKKESFNIIQYSDEYRLSVPVGNEYRFFFAKYGHHPKSQFEYNLSENLLIFSEVKNLDLDKLQSWELEQFGKIELKKTKKYKIGDIILYKIKKSI